MLQEGLQKYLDKDQLSKLAKARVGIAGVGGLGSNCAIMLARCGIMDFILIDADIVDASNLNRQNYMPCHVGMPKVEALSNILLELNPHIKIEKHILHMQAEHMHSLLPTSPYWVEAFDLAESKKLFVEHSMQACVFTVSASGICGFGGPPMQQRNFGPKLVLVGDFSSDMQNFSPLAPRVMQAAAMQADVILTKILTD